jgi:aspartate-semialdehyde dehydrogenase
MSPRRADFTGTAHVAVVGAETPSGARLRAALAAAGFPGDRLDLFGEGPGEEAVLSEYAGEARLIQPASPGEIVGHGVVFLCETGDAVRRLVRQSGPGVTYIDLVGAVETERTEARVLRVPSPVALLLADLLRPLQAAFGVREAVAVVLRPAADRGQPGLDELRDQTVRLLSFASVPKDVFGRQLAFNVLPEGAEAALAAEVAHLVGWEQPRLSVSSALVPVFHGHTVLLRLLPEERVEPGAVERVLREAEGLRGPAANTAETPMDAAEGTRIDVARVGQDGLGGFWLWAVAGDADGAAAEQALRMAAGLAAL